MKKLFIRLACAVFVLSMVACGKESSALKNIEGTWGLIRTEYTISGGTEESGYEEYNPFAPSSSDDTKFVIIHTVDKNYLVTSYGWNKQKSSWGVPHNTTWIINGNKVLMEESELEFILKLSSDTFSLERTFERMEDGEKNVYYNKFIFRKMSDLLE